MPCSPRRRGRAMAATASDSGIGASVLRKEDAPLITGQGRYVDDIKLPGMAYAAFAALAARARRHPRHRHLRGRGACPASSRSSPTTRSGSRPAFPAPRTRSATPSSPSGRSWPTARCAWSASWSRSSSPITAALARDAADRIVVDYDPLPVVIDAENAGKPGAPQLHEEAPGNHCLHDRAQDRGLRRRLRRRAREGLADDRQPAPHRRARSSRAAWWPTGSPRAAS